MNTNFFVKDMGLGFPTNLLTLGNSKIGLSKVLDFSESRAEDEESESESSEKKKNLFSFPGNSIGNTSRSSILLSFYLL